MWFIGALLYKNSPWGVHVNDHKGKVAPSTVASEANVVVTTTKTYKIGRNRIVGAVYMHACTRDTKASDTKLHK